MSSEISVSQVLANLEAQMAFHQEREAHHAEQEPLHREQRAVHTSEHAAIARTYETFKASGGGAAKLRPSARLPGSIPFRLLCREVGRPVAELDTLSQICRDVAKSMRRRNVAGAVAKSAEASRS